MTKPPPKTFGKVSRERILLSGKNRCHVCGRGLARGQTCAKCRRAGW